MAAPSYEALLDTQNVVEAALAAYFTANGLPAYASRSQEDMPDSRVEIQYEPGPSDGHQCPRTFTGTGNNELDWFQGVIGIRVITERAKVGPSPDAALPDAHSYSIARAKVLMLRGAINGTLAGITALDIPYHIITVHGFAGQQDSIPENGFDETELGYAVQLQILTSAWPVASP